jgi:Phospholipase A2
MMKIAKPSPKKAGGVHVPKPKSQANPIVDGGSSGKGSGDKKIGSHAGLGKNVAKVRKSAKDPQRYDETSTTSALYPVGEVPIPVVSELAEIGLLDDQITPQQLNFPVYGNYCGFGHGDPTGNTPPIDAVDAVCREHDRCYRLLGDFDSRCDRNLIEIMPTAIASTPSPIGKKAGFLALLYFSLAEQNLALGQTLFKRT